MRYAWLLFASSLLLAGCWSAGDEVVVYTALDREFSESVLEELAAQGGPQPRPKFDIESTKSVGLTQAILSEASNPRCDVFWNNEILNTLRLEEQGLLEAYESPAAANLPAMYRSPRGTWHGFAGRARVLIVNTKLVPEAERPKSIEDLTDPKWKGQIGIAKPIAGTTATHAACLFAVLGADQARGFFRRLKANGVQVLGGNKQVAQAVAAGQIAFGLTDTDDAIIELERGAPVAIVYPDSQPDELGTLFIPNTVAIIKGCPHPTAARKLVDFLLSPAVEERLAAGPSAQIPLNPRVTAELRVETPHTVRAMPVDFAAAAKEWDAAAKFLQEEFLAP
ncbi:MAG: extracellular solute-binding protein [Pirellulaceae bacterium]|nr:extracellular solute-binding protein [Pirellulaceae bacterium]